MIEYVIGVIGAGVAGGVAYGDLRAKIGKLEGKVDLLSKNITIYMDNNHKKE